jgi:hypothetical protein
MRQRRYVLGDDKSRDDRNDRYDRHQDHGHGQVPLPTDGHSELHAKLHEGKRGKRTVLRLCDRQALEQRVDSRLREHRAHRKSCPASREVDQAGDGSLRRNQLN